MTHDGEQHTDLSMILGRIGTVTMRARMSPGSRMYLYNGPEPLGYLNRVACAKAGPVQEIDCAERIERDAQRYLTEWVYNP